MTVTPQPETRLPTAACGHRGDSSRYRENTLAAVSSAIAAGAGFVEVDVRVTADGAVVLLHDSTLERLWGVAQDVAKLDWSELRELGDGENRIPLLVEALALFENSSSTLLIDMETAEPAVAAYRAVEAYRVLAGTGARVAWCGSLDGMRIIRSLDASARIWMPWNQPGSPTVTDIEALAPEYINSDFQWMTRALVEHIHALGCMVSVWTVDDEYTMRWARRIGVDSVTTNQLNRLQQVIAEAPSGGSEPAAIDTGELDLDRALVVARGLGQWAIDFARSSDLGQISTKKDAADLVTEVDVAVERHVRAVIGEYFQGYGFVGEEMGGSAAPGAPCWYLDPVDGTTNFANRIPWNAFSLALAVDNVSLIGVVVDPWRGDLFEAVRGGGARLNGSPLSIVDAESQGDPLSGRVVSTELASHLAWPGMLEMLETLGSRYCTMRIMGSGTMTLVGVAAGRGVGSIIGSFGAVDHLAAALIVQEAGGIVLDSNGKPNTFPSSGGIMAAAPHAAAALFEVWHAACAAAEE